MFKYLATPLLVAASLSGVAVANPVDKSSTSMKYERTVSVFEQAVKRAPGDETAWLNLGMAYRELGRTADAHAAFAKVLVLENATLQDRFGNDVWSHQLARTALAKMPQIASRD